MNKLSQVIVLSGLLRFLLPTLLPQLPYILSTTVEVCTPINSFKTLGEAFYYLQHGINLYNGGFNSHPPLLVSLLSFVNDLGEPASLVGFNLIYTLVDIKIMFNIVALNKWYTQHNSKRLNKQVNSFSDELVASFYLFNPLVIITNVSHSTLVFALWFLSESLVQAASARNLKRSMMCLAIAGYISLNLNFLLIPILSLYQAASTSSWYHTVKVGVYAYASAIILLLGGSYVGTSSWEFLYQCYGSVIKFDKITPNMGLWWYIFTEMFEFFTPFYLGVFNIFSIIFIIPFTIRFHEFFENNTPFGDSLLAVVLSYVWLSFTKSYSVVGDLGFALSLIPIFRGTNIPHCNFIYVTALTLLVSLLLSPIFYYTWIVLGTGNSNFFYSLNLIWGGVHILILMDLVWARITFDYVQEHKVPDDRKYKLRLTQI